jgi:hypothetical protein
LTALIPAMLILAVCVPRRVRRQREQEAQGEDFVQQ